MTGFGRGAVAGEDFKVAVEIKTVNNRYLDIHLRLGQELSSLEMNLRKLISSRLSRAAGRPQYQFRAQRHHSLRNQSAFSGRVHQCPARDSTGIQSCG